MKNYVFVCAILLAVNSQAVTLNSISGFIPAAKKSAVNAPAQERTVNRYQAGPVKMAYIETKVYKEFFSRRCAFAFPGDTNADGC